MPIVLLIDFNYFTAGVGKSVTAKSVLTTLAAGQDYVPVPLSFSAQTSSARTQEILEANLEKKRKALLGAPVGKKVLVFVDDVNMPAPDTYGSQPPIELLRYGIYKVTSRISGSLAKEIFGES